MVTGSNLSTYKISTVTFVRKRKRRIWIFIILLRNCTKLLIILQCIFPHLSSLYYTCYIHYVTITLSCIKYKLLLLLSFHYLSFVVFKTQLVISGTEKIKKSRVQYRKKVSTSFSTPPLAQLNRTYNSFKL